jgi:hypothetical protein
MFHPMRRLGRVLGLDHQAWRSASRASRRRRTSNPLSQVPAEVSRLEERCLMSGWWVNKDSVLSKSDHDGGIRIDIKQDTSNPYDAILGQNDISVVPDQTYTLRFKLSTNDGNTQRFNVTWVLQEAKDPYKKYFLKEFEIPATGSKLKIVDLSVPVSNKNASLQLWLGGPGGAQKVKDRVVDLKDFSFSEATDS